MRDSPLVKALMVVVGGMGAILAISTAWIYITTNTDATSGPGWQLVGAARGGPWTFLAAEADKGELVEDQGSLGDLWSVLALESPPPEPDFGQQVLVRATGFGSGSCPSTSMDSIPNRIAWWRKCRQRSV